MSFSIFENALRSSAKDFHTEKQLESRRKDIVLPNYYKVVIGKIQEALDHDKNGQITIYEYNDFTEDFDLITLFCLMVEDAGTMTTPILPSPNNWQTTNISLSNFLTGGPSYDLEAQSTATNDSNNKEKVTKALNQVKAKLITSPIPPPFPTLISLFSAVPWLEQTATRALCRKPPGSWGSEQTCSRKGSDARRNGAIEAHGQH